MPKVITKKSVELFPAIMELLRNNQKVRFSVTGNSMLPFLHENTDSVEISEITFKQAKFLQVVLIKRENDQLILHRIVFKGKNSFYIAGDAQNWIEGPLAPDCLIAAVTDVWRNGKHVDCSGLLWRMLSFLWWFRLPLRFLVKKVPRYLKAVFKTLSRGDHHF